MSIEDIKNFFSGGFIDSFRDLLINLVFWVVRFFNNVVNIMLYPIVNKINQLLPNVDDLSGKIQYVFNFASPYINFFLDLLFLSSPILTYLILSMIFRVLIKNSTYIIKVITKWWDALFI